MVLRYSLPATALHTKVDDEHDDPGGDRGIAQKAPISLEISVSANEFAGLPVLVAIHAEM